MMMRPAPGQDLPKTPISSTVVIKGEMMIRRVCRSLVRLCFCSSQHTAASGLEVGLQKATTLRVDAESVSSPFCFVPLHREAEKLTLFLPEFEKML